MHLLDYADVKDRLPEAMTAEAWAVIRPNLHDMGDVDQWWRVVTGPISAPEFSAEDRDFLAIARGKMEVLEASSDLWKELTGALKEETGRKGKPLFMPLRLALTGLDHGPDMNILLPLIGRDTALARLTEAS